MLEAAPATAPVRPNCAATPMSASSTSAAWQSSSARTADVADLDPRRASPYRAGAVDRATPTRVEPEIAIGAHAESVASADRERKPALGRMLSAFSIEAPMEPRAAVRFHGKGFDTDRQDPRMPGGNVDAAVKAFEGAAMRSAGLSLVSTLVSAVVSGTRRLSQGS